MRLVLLLTAILPMTTMAKPDTDFLRLYAETRRFTAGTPVNPTPTPDGKAVLFLRSPPKSPVQTLYSFDVATGQTHELLTAESVLQGAQQTLSPEEKARLERQRISARGFTHFVLSKDGRKVMVGLSGKLYVLDRETGKVQPLKVEGALDARFSPDGKTVSFVKGHDLHAIELATGHERALTHGGTATKTHGIAEFVAQEEMGRFTGYWWSPDSSHVAYEIADLSKMEQFHLQDMMHPEQAPEVFRYPRAGQANADVGLALTSVHGGKPVLVHWDAKSYPYLAKVSWEEHSPLTILVQNRTQTEEVLLRVDPRTGATHPLLTEKDEAWVELVPNFPKWRKDGSGFFWYTERHGGPEVELRAQDGSLKESWVKPDAHFESLVGFDEEGGWLYFTGNPTQPEARLYRVRSGQKPEEVKTGYDGPRTQLARLSKKGDVLVVGTATATQLVKYDVLRPDGAKLGTLPSVTATPPFTPKLDIRKVGEGEGYWATVIHPRDFKPGTKLPVIVEVYGGPTATVVHQSMRDSLLSQWMADQGFLVVKFDNRGTPGRDRKWSRAVKYDFAGVTMDDQVAALHALAKELPELDLSRVGMEGWSFGGYMSALSVLKRPDVFKAAVAGAPVVDWRDYDTHYTERYLGLPQQHPEAYEKSSLLPYAPHLGGALLVIHGTADDNVYFLHSLKLSNALFRAGKVHDLLPLAGFTHMVPDPLVTERLYARMVGFFREHLR
jgi:dipeptidyl-peptidase-4